MKLLLFSDLHCNIRAAQRLVEYAQKVDVFVGAGDFGNVRQGINLTIDVLRSINLPTVLVPGNSESVEELRQACHTWPQAHVLHGDGISINGIPFFGLGGGVPITPFGSWSYDFTEEQARKLLVGCPPQCILVSHSPPKGMVDSSSDGQSLGSLAIREIIDQKHPLLVVCGHIHGSAGRRASVGKTTVINAGPKGIEFELKDTAGRGDSHKLSWEKKE